MGVKASGDWLLEVLRRPKGSRVEAGALANEAGALTCDASHCYINANSTGIKNGCCSIFTYMYLYIRTYMYVHLPIRTYM